MEVVKNNELLYAMQKIKLDVSEMNVTTVDGSWSFPNLRASFSRVYIPIEGEAYICANGEKTPLEVGKVYMIPYGMSFTCGCPSSMKKLFFHFNLRDPKGGDAFEGVDRFIILEGMEELASKMLELFENSDAMSAVRMKILLYDIIGAAIALLPERRESIREFSAYTESAIAYIRDHLSARLTVGEIADAVFVSKQVLQKRFCEDVGKPMGKYIDDKLMEKAERYLLDKSLSLREISERLGYCDQFYFSRRFSEIHGISPLRFRKAHYN